MEVRVLRRAIGWLHSSRLNYSMPLAKAGVRCVVGAGGLECEWFLAFRLPNVFSFAQYNRRGICLAGRLGYLGFSVIFTSF